MDRDTVYDDSDYLTETCRQCGDVVRVEDESRPDGPFVCDDCVRLTVNRAARSTFSNYLWDTGVMLAKVQR